MIIFGEYFKDDSINISYSEHNFLLIIDERYSEYFLNYDYLLKKSNNDVYIYFNGLQNIKEKYVGYGYKEENKIYFSYKYFIKSKSISYIENLFRKNKIEKLLKDNE